jgi:hypothetical protein
VDRRFRWLALLTFVAGVLSPSLALSAPKDAAATKLADDAINNDYLATNFAEAEKKLKSAVTMCGANACSAQTRARLHRDLGVVYVAGMNRVDDGKKEFGEALKADPNIALEKDLTTPEVEKAFQAAKGGGAATPAPTAKAPAAAGGDMVVTPTPEQAVLTPVPIYVELPEGVEVAKVIARYKPFGTTDWKTLELHKIEKGFGGEIPCQEVGSATGDLSYYVQATDGAGDVVSTSGSRNAPNKVAIKNEITGEAPHLPGKPPGAQCRDKADCPPGFPGCMPGKKKSPTGNKSWGDACQKDIECGEGLSCKSGQCETGEKTDGSQLEVDRPCETKSDCNEGEACGADKLCEGAGAGRKLWISLSVQPDLSVVASQNNVCGSVNVEQASNVKCISEDGSDYVGIPDEGFVGDRRGNAIKGGTHLPGVRALVGIDYLLLGNLSLGARLGYSFGGVAPGNSIAALHAEARVTYWFGKNPFRKTTVRPYAALIGGLAEVDDKFDVPVHECTSGRCIAAKPNMAFPASQTLTVWRKAGGAFAGLAAGAMIPVGPKQGVIAEVKVQRLVPNSGVVVSPSVGYAFGF